MTSADPPSERQSRTVTQFAAPSPTARSSTKRSVSATDGTIAPAPEAIENKRLKTDVIHEICGSIHAFLIQIGLYLQMWRFLSDSRSEDQSGGARKSDGLHPWFYLSSGMLGMLEGTATLIKSYSIADPRAPFEMIDVEAVVEIIRTMNLDLPVLEDLSPEDRAKYPKDSPPDLAQHLLHILVSFRDRILDLASSLADRASKPTPSEFGKGTGWHEMQRSSLALLCHRPGYKRPHIPLKFRHKAFELCVKESKFDDDVFEGFRLVAQELAECLTDSVESEATRGGKVLEALRKVFPEGNGYEWVSEDWSNGSKTDHIYRRKRQDSDGRQPGFQKVYEYTTLIIVEIKLEEGYSGDGYMQLCRYFDNMINSEPRYRETGAPTFLISMSGPNVKFCGGWSDPVNKIPEIDVFKTMFVCLDVAYESREDLAQTLRRLHEAIQLLPKSHVLPADRTARAVTNVPAVFDQYRILGKGNPSGLHRLTLVDRLLDDARHTVFRAHAEIIPPSCPVPTLTDAVGVNCIAKLTYRRYGRQVHEALHPEFAPVLFGISESEVGGEVYLMEYLASPTKDQPGWKPLTKLSPRTLIQHREAICTALDRLLEALARHGFVHGDLRASNLMIAVDSRSAITTPVEIKAVDYEWAGIAGNARYPSDRSSMINYPGRAGSVSQISDDQKMVNQLKDELFQPSNV